MFGAIDLSVIAGKHNLMFVHLLPFDFGKDNGKGYRRLRRKETTLILEIESNCFSPNLRLVFLNDLFQVQVNKSIRV